MSAPLSLPLMMLCCHDCPHHALCAFCSLRFSTLTLGVSCGLCPQTCLPLANPLFSPWASSKQHLLQFSGISQHFSSLHPLCFISVFFSILPNPSASLWTSDPNLQLPAGHHCQVHSELSTFYPPKALSCFFQEKLSPSLRLGQELRTIFDFSFCSLFTWCVDSVTSFLPECPVPPSPSHAALRKVLLTSESPISSCNSQLNRHISRPPRSIAPLTPACMWIHI